MIYELITDERYGSMIKATDKEGKVYWIPMDEANSDYQRYLRWLENPEAEQSTPIVINEAETI
jgi:hypothetical protein